MSFIIKIIQIKSLKLNLVANVVGKLSLASITLISYPYYLKLLGSESFGLISFYTVLQSVFLLIDCGLSSAYAQQTAKYFEESVKRQDLLDLTVTLEKVLFFVGVMSALVVIEFSTEISTNWLNNSTLQLEEKIRSIELMGLIIGLQIPFMLYQAGLSGIQAHLKLNLLLVVIAILRNFGGVLLIVFVSKGVETYFVWQVFVGLVQLLSARYFIFNAMFNVSGMKGVFDVRLIKKILGFSAGFFATSVVGYLLTETDKILVSKMLSLEVFGYYTLACVLANFPQMIATPINSTFYPKLAQLVSRNDDESILSLYRLSCSLISAIVFPVGLTIAVYSSEIMFLWTGDAKATEVASSLLSILVIGNILSAIMLIPYSLQLAHSWTRLGFLKNLVTLIIAIPTIIVLVQIYGVIGAACLPIIVQTLQIAIILTLMHKKILIGEKTNWYLNSLVKPAITSIFSVFLVKNIAINVLGLQVGFALIAFTSILAVILSIQTVSILRKFFKKSY